MPIIPNPQTQTWRGIFPGRFLGDIWQSWNIDLEVSKGKVTISERPALIADGTDASKLGCVKNFLRTDADTTDRWWGLTSNGMVNTSGSTPTIGWANDALVNSPTDPNDMVVHETNNNNQRLLVTRNSDIAILNRSGANNIWTASWWVGTLAQTALSLSYTHPIERLDRLVAVGDGEFIHTIDQSDNVAYKRLTFNSSYKCTAIYVSLTRFWFIMQSKFGGKSIIAEWDGGAEKANNIYEINGNAIFGFIYDDIPWIITDDGAINKFNGRGFSVVATFPNNEERIQLVAPSTHRNCAIEDNLVNILINAPFTSTRMRAGVWTFDPNTYNLYHRWGLGQYKLSVGTNKDYGQGYIQNVGAIVNTYLPGRFLIGAIVYSNYNSIYVAGIYRLLNQSNRGYFITTLISSNEIEDHWYNIWIRFRKFLTSSESIVTKYRISEGLVDSSALTPQYATATWVTATTFTAVVPTGVIVGNEVEVINGDNGGCTFSISSLSATPNGVSTITVTIDESAPQTSTNSSLVYFNDWVKISNNNPITTSLTNITRTVNQIIGNATAASGPYIQFKIELRGIAVEVDQLRIDNKTQTASGL